jgi:hypothetical protein
MGQESSNSIRTIVIAIILFYSLVGCDRAETQQSGFIPTTSATETKIILPANTQTARSSLSSTASPTLQPSTPTRRPTETSKPSNTPSPQPSATWTSLPTLTTLKAQQTVTSFYDNNGECEMPCWWGITPGKTTWQEARAKLSPLATEKGPYQMGKRGAYAYYYYVPFPMGFHPSTLIDYGPMVIIQKGIVYAVGINSAEIKRGQDTSLVGLLKVLGVPDEIWINMQSYSPDNKPEYELDLFYANKGVLLSRFGTGFLSKNTVLFCPQMPEKSPYPFALGLFSPTEGITYGTLTDTIRDRDTSIDKFHLLRDLIDGFSEADFYRLYSDPTTEKCLTIPLYKLR